MELFEDAPEWIQETLPLARKDARGFVILQTDTGACAIDKEWYDVHIAQSPDWRANWLELHNQIAIAEGLCPALFALEPGSEEPF